MDHDVQKSHLFKNSECKQCTIARGNTFIKKYICRTPFNVCCLPRKLQQENINAHKKACYVRSNMVISGKVFDLLRGAKQREENSQIINFIQTEAPPQSKHSTPRVILLLETVSWLREKAYERPTEGEGWGRRQRRVNRNGARERRQLANTDENRTWKSTRFHRLRCSVEIATVPMIRANAGQDHLGSSKTRTNLFQRIINSSRVGLTFVVSEFLAASNIFPENFSD